MECYKCYKDAEARPTDHDQRCGNMQNHVLPGFMRQDYDRRIVEMRNYGAMGSLEHDVEQDIVDRYNEELDRFDELRDNVVFGTYQSEIPIPHYFGNFDRKFYRKRQIINVLF